ncbi:MAG: cytochrome c3 family protein [Pyrinomonadaceae bacterium]
MGQAKNLILFKRLKGIFVILFVTVAVFGFVKSAQMKTQEPPTSPEASEGDTFNAPSKWSSFSHAKHKLKCSSCHKFPSSNWKSVRARSEAFPDITEYPSHQSCIGCHRAQFFSGRTPQICTICHTSPSPKNSSRYPFPNPRERFDKSSKGRNAESDFLPNFPHATHSELFGLVRGSDEPQFIKASARRNALAESCSVCHQIMAPQGDSNEEYYSTPPKNLGDGYWLKKGTFETAPLGHSLCFTCHSTKGGITPQPSNCAACHKLKGLQPTPDFSATLARTMGVRDKVMLQTWRARHSAGKFRHEFESHKDMDCASCHSTETMKTYDPKTIKVNVASCAPCHITATADDGGILNYEVEQRTANPKFECTKCHITFGKKAIPNSHSEAITAQQ